MCPQSVHCERSIAVLKSVCPLIAAMVAYFISSVAFISVCVCVVTSIYSMFNINRPKKCY